MRAACSVNLVPAAFRHRRARLRRGRRWSHVAGAFAALVALGWTGTLLAGSAVRGLSSELNALRTQQGELEQQRGLKNQQEERAINRLAVVAATRRPQPWPGRLARIAAAIPEPVALSALEIATVQRVAPRPVSVSPGQPSPALVAAPALPLEGRLLTLRGHALDHASLMQFIRALEALGDWAPVELVRANVEPFGTGTAIAFEVLCHEAEVSP